MVYFTAFDDGQESIYPYKVNVLGPLSFSPLVTLSSSCVLRTRLSKLWSAPIRRSSLGVDELSPCVFQSSTQSLSYIQLYSTQSAMALPVRSVRLRKLVAMLESNAL